MKQYVLIRKDELTDSLMQALDIGHRVRLTSIQDAQGNETDYYVAKVTTESYPEALKGYKRFTKEEVKPLIQNIKNGMSVQRLMMPSQKISVFPNPEGVRARFRNGFKLTVGAGQTVSQDFLLTEERLLTGAKIWGSNVNFGDSATFEVVHPLLGVMDRFVENWYLADGWDTIDAYPARLPAGLILRVTYKNTGSSQARLLVNLFLHKAV